MVESMKNSQSLHKLVENILSKEGRHALDAWAEAINKIEAGNIDLVEAIHKKVSKHLVLQIESTFKSKGEIK
jgi:hypothetical protein